MMVWHHPALGQRSLDEQDAEIRELRAEIERLTRERREARAAVVEVARMLTLDRLQQASKDTILVLVDVGLLTNEQTAVAENPSKPI